MNLSDLKDGDATLVQRTGNSSAPLSLSAINPDDVQMVQAAPSVARSTLDHFANAAAMGYLPQLQGVASQLFPDPSSGVDAKLRAQGFKIDQPENTYLSNRDAMVSQLDNEAQANPYASAAGTVGGAITGGIALSPLTPIKGANMVARAKQAAAVGALYGAVSNPGDNAGQINPIQPIDRTKNAAVGYIAGGVLQPAIEGVTGAAGWLKNQFSDYAADKAAKAIGMTKADYNRLGPDKARALGRAALDQGIVTPLATPAKVEAVTDTMKDEAGQKLGQIIDQAQGQLDQMGPTGYMQAGKPIQGTPIRRGVKIGDPETQSFYPQAHATASPDFSGIDPSEFTPRRINGAPEPTDAQLAQMAKAGNATAKQNLVRANSLGADPYSGPIQAQVSPLSPTMERAGPSGDFLTPIQPRPAGSIDAPALAQNLRAQGDSAKLAKIPGMEGLASKINGFLDTLSSNSRAMNIRDAQTLRQGIDSAINWGKRVPDMAGTQQYLVNIRNALSDAMNNSVDQAASKSGGALGQLRQANQNYSTLSKINDIAANRAAMNSANRAVGLTDTIATGAGAGVGASVGGYVAGPLGAEVGAGAGGVVGGGLNKFGRTYGPAIQANAGDAVSNIAGRVASAGRAIGTIPGVAPTLIQTGLRQNPPASGAEIPPDVAPNGLAQSQANRQPAAPARGEDAWAQQGIQKLGIQDQNLVNQLLQSPKGKQLLIQASDLAPGSKAMQRIIEQIQKGYGKK